METKGSAFQKELHKEYVRLSGMEAAEYDWRDAAFFNDRARRAGAGENFGPQEMSERSLPAETVPLIEASRERLMQAFAEGAANSKPGPAARAQAAFDCWLQEQEENIQPDDIAACQDAFMAALRELRAVQARPVPPAPPPPAPPPPAPKPAPAPPPAGPLPGPFVVPFGFNSAALDAAGKGIVKEAADAAKEGPAATIIITGHTDRAGSNAYNQKLSEARAAAVAAELRSQGVSGGIVRMNSRGETSPAVATPDGVKEAENRRVEILLLR